MNISSGPLISICVPTYNGFPYIQSLIDELILSSRSDFEIVISDDGSTDGTWEYVSQKSIDDPRVKAFSNEQNLGMDANFAKTVSLAGGRYVWLCGQDDKIFHEGIESVTALLEKRPDLDFVYLNHVKVLEGDDQDSSLDKPEYGIHHVYGHGLNEYLNHHDYELPTFLPKYILRKNLWESVNIGKYFGTCYCQVGVFLEVSKGLNWCHFDGNYVVGLTPANGWQSSPEQFTKISLGMYSMLCRSSKEMAWLDSKVLTRLVNKNYKRFIMSCLLLKSIEIKPEERIIQESLLVIKSAKALNLCVRIILTMPRWFSICILKLVSCRRSVRKHIIGVSPQGPKID
ncbi:MAG: glycosyltransferase [Methylophaga sp.]